MSASTDSGGNGRSDQRSGESRVIRLNRRQEKRSEAVARAILHDIAVARTTPGEPLPSQAEMLARYRVGRSTLREALRILEINGLVGSKPGPGGGSHVEMPTPQVIGQILSLHFQALGMTAGDLFRARLVLDPFIARLAARCTDPQLRAQLEESMQQLEPRAGAGSLEFHRCVIEMVDEDVIRICALALFEVIKLRYIESFGPAALEHIHDEHVAIGQAVLAGDGERAEKLMYDHLADLDLSAFNLEQLIEWR